MSNWLNIFFEGMGKWAAFCRKLVTLAFREGVAPKELIHQMVQVGVRSIPITCIAGLFVGAILAIQINLQLKDFGAQGFLGGLSTSTTLRNLGPVLIAFLLAGRVGAYTSAELGTMAITDQLNAIRCLGLDPFQKILIPRLVAVVVSSFLLLTIGLGMTVLGGILISVSALDVNALQFISHIPQFVSVRSISLGMIKSVIFGFMIGSVSCFFGFYTEGGAEAVGKTVRKTAVVILVSILIVDFLVSVLGGGR